MQVAPWGEAQMHVEHAGVGAVSPALPMKAETGYIPPHPGSFAGSPSYSAKYPVHPAGAAATQECVDVQLGSEQSTVAQVPPELELELLALPEDVVAVVEVVAVVDVVEVVVVEDVAVVMPPVPPLPPEPELPVVDEVVVDDEALTVLAIVLDALLVVDEVAPPVPPVPPVPGRSNR